MKSSALLRTNVALTTNIKFMVGSSYSLYLDSIVSTPELDDTKYKKVQFNKDNYWDELVPYFFKGTPADIAYKIKYDSDADNMSTDFANQYDGLYQYGARNIVDNKDYTEEFEYFAPLHISKGKLPSNFIIFRIDGPGLMGLTKDTFREEILLKLKFVKNFDLSKKTVLGQWLDNNINSNKSYPNQSLYIDFRRLEFSSWTGIDYEDGGYSEKSFLLDSTFEYEQPYLEMENLILNGYKNNKIVYPNLINFSFLFDDTPATPNQLRKWSLNRYLGFYLDELNLIKSVSPCRLPTIKSDVKIDDRNILYSVSGGTPFVEILKKDEVPYIEIDGVYYKIEKFDEYTANRLQKVMNSRNSYEEKISNSKVTRYKIISESLLKGKELLINKNLIKIDSNNRILTQSGDNYIIEDFNSADIWIMQISDHFHNLRMVDGVISLYTDYAFEQSYDKFKYYINKSDASYTKTLDLIITQDNTPTEFKIYKCKFTDIKDFDTDIVDTEFSKFEYEEEKELTDTDEQKMYTLNLDSFTEPKDYVEFKLVNDVVNIPSSSEYTANSETFRIVNNTLSNLWRKNSERLKWGYLGSISSNDYPYLLNNSFSAEDFNRAPNTKDSTLSRDKRNLDYFYTANSERSDYIHQSLHVEDYSGGVINTNFKFELEKYLGLSHSSDYFSYFFGKKSYLNDGNIIKRTEKYSTFQSGDSSTPNITLFRGLKFYLSEVENLNVTDGKIEKINLKNSNKFDSWKFSIVLSKNDYIVLPSATNTNSATVSYFENVLKWRTIDHWKHDKIYATNSLVVYNEVLYNNPTQSIINLPNSNPTNNVNWIEYDKPTIFYSSKYKGLTSSNNMSEVYPGFAPLVYNFGEFYYSNGVPNDADFWSSTKTYSAGNIATYKNQSWISLTQSNRYLPSENSVYISGYSLSVWDKYELGTRWKQVELWKSEYDYESDPNWNQTYFSKGSYVVYDDVVYGSSGSTTVGVPPTLDSTWVRVYSMVPDTNYLYGPSFSENNIIEMNGKLYQCVSNQPNSLISNANGSLDNGIYVIINEKHQNVLVNIYVNDNTYSDTEFSDGAWDIVKDNLTNTNRDDLYTTIYTKLSANNFMNCLNDLSNKFGFSDLVKYVVVKEDGSIQIYDFNNLSSVNSLPYLLTCEPPDEFLVRIKSNKYSSLNLKSSEIKSRRALSESQIDSLDQMNHYNGMHLATEIERRKDDTPIIPNYSRLKNQIFYVIYRHSGFYSPILRTIDLFDSPSLTQSVTNYKFDTDFTDFGIMKQRVISKVNRKNNILKLRNNPNLKSVYPMLDEFGYQVVDFFIFKSTWDFGYHYECNEVTEKKFQVSNTTLIKNRTEVFSNNNQKLL
jgi:hypothetical protein